MRGSATRRWLASLLTNYLSSRALAAVPPGVRVYAIGDIHGRLDLLEDLLARLNDDHAGRSPLSVQLIFLGDLINRGPDSAAVIQKVADLMEATSNVRLLMGNHEEVLVQAARGNGRAARAFLEMAGLPTLLSYGISEDKVKEGDFDDLAALIGRQLPPDHIALLESAETFIALGDYAFVHAGIRPGIALDRQQTSDLRWIREEFTYNRADHGAVIDSMADLPADGGA